MPWAGRQTSEMPLSDVLSMSAEMASRFSDTDVVVKGIALDSRRVQPGICFSQFPVSAMMAGSL